MWGTQALGLSAQAIRDRSGRDYPHDPSDLLRCIEFCRYNSLDSADLAKRMAGKSVEWDRLLPEWDSLAELLQHEIDTRTDRTAPRTYAEMKRVLADGVICRACNGAGRGIECGKCKGTGRRSGGRCRADRCWNGADFCPPCRGRGFTTSESN